MSSSYWYSQMTGIAKTLRHKRERKSTVDTVNGQLGANYYDNCCNVNGNITTTCLEIGAAVKKNSSFTNRIGNKIEYFYQSDGSSDMYTSNAMSHLSTESAQLAREITNLENDYNTAKNNYYAALRAEEEERQRQAAAAAAAAAARRNNSVKA